MLRVRTVNPENKWHPKEIIPLYRQDVRKTALVLWNRNGFHVFILEGIFIQGHFH